MKKFPFKQAQFFTTAMAPKGYPTVKSDKGEFLPEIAVAGRSNVGKSTLLNHLFATKSLVKTSSTPGKTQSLNFFQVDNNLMVADLPGYGYAKVPDKVRRHWGPMTQTYLQNRDSLHLILFLVDIRRVPNEDDRKLMEWILAADKAVILVITKVDKIAKNRHKAHTEKILEAFGLEGLYYIHYSATKNIGRKPLIAMINDALTDEIEGS